MSTLAIVGAIIALWPLGQSAYSQWSQQKLRAQWEQAARAKPAAHQKIALKKVALPKPEVSIEDSKAQSSKISKPMWPATRLIIADAQTDTIVLDGWDESTLRRAPGHFPGSALPGQKGNCVIAGHRNVYGSPFYRVDGLNAGSVVTLETTDATYNYQVLNVSAATDSDMTVLQAPSGPDAKPRLTLVTCTLPRTSNRIIVTAEMEDASF